MESTSFTHRWLARAITLAVPVACIAGPLASSAEAAPKPKTPAPSFTAKPGNPTNDTSGTFAWQVAANTTYSCALDRAARASCAGAFHAPGKLADGLHTLTIRSQTQGLRSSNFSYSWRVDTLAPAAPGVTAPPALTSDTAVSVSFSDADTSVVRYTCAVDGQAAAACASPFTQSGFADGAHTLVVTAYDAAGNGASTSTHWTVDHTAPDIPVVVSPPTPTNATSASIVFSDGSATSFACSLDGAPASACTSPAAVNGLTEGAHTFAVTAYDAAANHTASAVTWSVDLTPPAKPSIITGPAAVTDDTSPTVQFVDLDPSGVSFACTVVDQTTGTVITALAPCSSPYVVTGATTDGDGYALTIVPTDGAGNQGPADSSVAWKLDLNVLPSPAQIVTAPGSPSNDATPTFGFIAPDAGQTGGATGFLCSLDGAAFADCGAADPTTATTFDVPSPLADGLHTFRVETVAGSSASAPVSWAWVVDTTAPSAPQVSAPDPSTANPTITFTTTDTTVSYLCSVDGAAFVACSSPWTPPAGLTDGSHTLVVETVDAAGNTTQGSPVTFVTQTQPGSQPPTPVTAPGGGPVAPTVTSIATPTSLTGGTTVTFSGSVTGLVAGAIRLAVSGATTSVPVRTTCLAAGAATACAGTFAAVRLVPTTPLVLGQHYVVTVDAGAVHDASGTPSVGSGATFRAARTIEESNSVLRSAWVKVSNRAAYGRSFVQEHLSGSTATWTFSGRSVTWWTVTGPAQGKANVYVDGVRRATVNNYAAATKFHVGRVVKGLANRRHKLTIKVLGVKGAKAGKGTFVAIDGFTVGKTRTSTPALTMRLRSIAGSHFFGSHAITGDIKGETVSVTFRGASITLTTMKGVTQGKVAAYVDGKLKATYDGYAAKTSYRVARTIGSLSDRVHTLKLVVLGTHHKGAKGNLVTVDRFAVR